MNFETEVVVDGETFNLFSGTYEYNNMFYDFFFYAKDFDDADARIDAINNCALVEKTAKVSES